jgi:hypothetical protein
MAGCGGTNDRSGVNDTYRMYLVSRRDGVDFNLASNDEEFATPTKDRSIRLQPAMNNGCCRMHGGSRPEPGRKIKTPTRTVSAIARCLLWKFPGVARCTYG